MAWQKSPQELIELFDAILPGPPVQRRLMFGYPAAFVNGNMFMGLFEDKLALRLPEFERDALLRTGGSVFSPMPDRPMREYVTMTKYLLIEGPALRGWVNKAMEFAMSLPPKTSAEDEPGMSAAPDRPKRKVAVKKAAAAPKPKRKPAKKAAPKRAAAAAKRKPVKSAAKTKRSTAKRAKAAARPKRAATTTGKRVAARKVRAAGLKRKAKPAKAVKRGGAAKTRPKAKARRGKAARRR